MRMLDEETNICEKYPENSHNQELVDLLNASLEEYGKLSDQTELNTDDQLLPRMYELIEVVSRIPMINEQVHAIRKHQQWILKSHERDVDA